MGRVSVSLVWVLVWLALPAAAVGAEAPRRVVVLVVGEPVSGTRQALDTVNAQLASSGYERVSDEELITAWGLGRETREPKDPPDAKALVEERIAQAEKALIDVDYVQVSKYLKGAREVLEKYPHALFEQRAEYYLIRGAVLLDRGEADEAAQELTQALRIRPGLEVDLAVFLPTVKEHVAAARGKLRTVAVALPGLPEGSRGWLDGAEMADGKANVTAGPHWLYVSAPGYRSVASEATVTDGGALPVDVLPPVAASLERALLRTVRASQPDEDGRAALRSASVAKARVVVLIRAQKSENHLQALVWSNDTSRSALTEGAVRLDQPEALAERTLPLVKAAFAGEGPFTPTTEGPQRPRSQFGYSVLTGYARQEQWAGYQNGAGKETNLDAAGFAVAGRAFYWKRVGQGEAAVRLSLLYMNTESFGGRQYELATNTGYQVTLHGGQRVLARVHAGYGWRMWHQRIGLRPEVHLAVEGFQSDEVGADHPDIGLFPGFRRLGVGIGGEADILLLDALTLEVDGGWGPGRASEAAKQLRLGESVGDTQSWFVGVGGHLRLFRSFELGARFEASATEIDYLGMGTAAIVPVPETASREDGRYLLLLSVQHVRGEHR